MRTTIRFAAMCCVTLFASSALAVQWTGSLDNWSDANNWAGGTLPGGFSSVEIDNGGTPLVNSGDSFVVGDVTIGSTAAAAGSLEVSGGELSPLSLKIGERGSGNAIVSGGSIFVDSGSLFIGGKDNAGVGELTVSGASTYIQSLDDFQLGRIGTGTLNMSDGEMEGVFTVVGKFGTGEWNQSGGLYVAKADMEIGDGGKPNQASTAGPRAGTINLSGGIMQVSGFAIGNRSGSGLVNISGDASLAATRSDGSNLWIGRGADWGAGEGGATELRITGGDATVVANNGFLMNADNVATSSTLIAEITGSTHTTIRVGGDANLSNGTFRVELSGYTPASGDSWTIVEAGADISAELGVIDAAVTASGFTELAHGDSAVGGTLAGTTFAVEDLSATLPAGLSWDLSYTSSEVVLSVTGMSSGVNGDFDGDGTWDGLDLDALTNEIIAGTNGAAFDLDGDGSVTVSDITDATTGWLAVAGAAELVSGNPFLTGDQNLNGTVDSTDLGLLLNNFGSAGGASYTGGDLNADSNVDSTDLGLLLNNFGSTASASAVPEPAGAAMAFLFAVGMFGFRVRRVQIM